MMRTSIVLVVLAALGAAVGWLARDLTSSEAPTAEATPRANETRTQSAAPFAPRAKAVAVAPPQPRDPRPLLLADVYSRDEVDRSSTDSIFVSKGAVSRLEREGLVRLIGDNDGKSLVACLRGDPEREEALVEWRIVSTEERVAILDVRLIEPTPIPEETACIDELMKGLEVAREPYQSPFMRGDQRRTNRVPLGIGLRAPSATGAW